MSVTIGFRGRLGNQMFQYAFGRLLAEQHGLSLTCIDPSFDDPLRIALDLGRKLNLDIGPTASLKGLSEYFPNAPLWIPGKVVDAPRVMLAEVTAPERERLFRDPPRNFHCCGFYQDGDLIAANREKIRHWFRFRPQQTPFRVDARDVLVNLRRGADYELLGWIVPTAFYTTLLSSLPNIRKVYICGIGITERVRRAFQEFRPTYIDGDAYMHLSLMSKFDRMVISNSSFSWWGAYLSDASEIYSPVVAPPAGSMPHMREDRYREIPAVALNVSKSLHVNQNRLRISNVVEKASNHVADGQTRYSDAQTLCQWLRSRETPFCLADLPASFHAQAEHNPAILIAQLLESGIVEYVPSTDD